jgi:hypothetical protein
VAAGGGERHARLGNQLRARRAAACAAQAKSKAAAEMESELEPLSRRASCLAGRSAACAEQQPVLPKPRTKAAAEMESELKLLAAASVMPARAISCVRAKQQPVLLKPRAKGAAEMESGLKPLAVASVTPVWAISCDARLGDQLCTRRAAACSAPAENDGSGRDGERAEVAGSRERHAWQGDQLRALSSSLCRPFREGKQRPRCKAS